LLHPLYTQSVYIYGLGIGNGNYGDHRDTMVSFVRVALYSRVVLTYTCT